MSALVGYGSSDEEDEFQPEKPAKIAKTDSAVRAVGKQANVESQKPPLGPAIPTIHDTRARSSTAQEDVQGPAPAPPISSPRIVDPPSATASSTNSPPRSPYTSTQQRLRELTMPTAPNFSIPDSPPPPEINSEEAASLAATTKKFERFLALKKQGVHFNERLRESASLRNPSLLPTLMEFAGISDEDAHASTLPLEAGGVPTRWHEEWKVEVLVRRYERMEKKRLAARDMVEFVPASTASPTKGESGKKSRFDQR